jgi:hypothetical protein
VLLPNDTESSKSFQDSQTPLTAMMKDYKIEENVTEDEHTDKDNIDKDNKDEGDKD